MPAPTGDPVSDAALAIIEAAAAGIIPAVAGTAVVGALIRRLAGGGKHSPQAAHDQVKQARNRGRSQGSGGRSN